MGSGKRFKSYKRNCQNCGNIFDTSHRHARLCDKCRRNEKREFNGKYKKRHFAWGYVPQPMIV